MARDIHCSGLSVSSEFVLRWRLVRRLVLKSPISRQFRVALNARLFLSGRVGVGDNRRLGKIQSSLTPPTKGTK